MNEFKAGDMVVISLPASRRGKTQTIHGHAGIVVVESRKKWGKRSDLVTTVKLGEPFNQKVHLRREHLVKATPEKHPELFI